MIFAVAILLRLNDNIGSEYEVAQLRRIVLAYLGFIFADMLWAFNADGLLVIDRFPNALLSAICVTCVTLGCFFWFKYLEDRLRWNIPPLKYRDILTALPVIAVCILDFISIFTGWLFIIDENNQYQTTDLFDVQSIVNYSYLLIPLIGSLFEAKKANSAAARKEYLTYPLLMVIPLICGLFEDATPNVPMLTLCIFMVIMIFYLMLQSRQGSTDALTGLCNKRWLEQFLEKKLESASIEEPVALFVMDIDDLTSINDTFGHIEGDNALKTFAAALQLVAARFNVFAARYGGDEFCLVVDISKRTPAEVERNIDATLHAALSVMATEAKPYKLSISFGHAICDHPEKKVSAFIERANDVLKESRHARLES